MKIKCPVCCHDYNVPSPPPDKTIRQKQYYETNKQKRQRYFRERYIKLRDKLLKKQKEYYVLHQAEICEKRRLKAAERYEEIKLKGLKNTFG